MTNLIYKSDPPVQFTENDPPSWLLTKDYSWWWTNHVLPLDVGKSIKSDFRKIKRIE